MRKEERFVDAIFKLSRNKYLVSTQDCMQAYPIKQKCIVKYEIIVFLNITYQFCLGCILISN